MATYTDIARRVYNHTFKLDPIIRSLLDTDFYKLLMLQMIWGLYPRVEATFSLINRTNSVRLAEEIDIDELRAQLDHCRTLRFSKKEMIWLAGVGEGAVGAWNVPGDDSATEVVDSGRFSQRAAAIPMAPTPSRSTPPIRIGDVAEGLASTG